MKKYGNSLYYPEKQHLGTVSKDSGIFTRIFVAIAYLAIKLTLKQISNFYQRAIKSAYLHIIKNYAAIKNDNEDLYSWGKKKL